MTLAVCSDKLHTICSSGVQYEHLMLKFANEIDWNDIFTFFDAGCYAKSIIQNKFKIVKLFWQQIFHFN
jgi:hypothetical protein